MHIFDNQPLGLFLRHYFCIWTIQMEGKDIVLGFILISVLQ